MQKNTLILWHKRVCIFYGADLSLYLCLPLSRVYHVFDYALWYLYFKLFVILFSTYSWSWNARVQCTHPNMHNIFVSFHCRAIPPSDKKKLTCSFHVEKKKQQLFSVRICKTIKEKRNVTYFICCCRHRSRLIAASIFFFNFMKVQTNKIFSTTELEAFK